MTEDSRKAKTLEEACRNENGSYNGFKLFSWLTEALAPGKGMTEKQVRKIYEQARKREK